MMRGDANKIAAMVGKSSPVLLYNALKKNSIEEMTASEKQIWLATLRYYQKKAFENAELEQKTMEISKLM